MPHKKQTIRQLKAYNKLYANLIKELNHNFNLIQVKVSLHYKQHDIISNDVLDTNFPFCLNFELRKLLNDAIQYNESEIETRKKIKTKKNGYSTIQHQFKQDKQRSAV